MPFADAVIVAAGASRRMEGIDKLEQDLDGRTVLQASVDAMARAHSVRGLVIVVGAERLGRVAAQAWVARHGARVVAGGPRRQDSVAAGVRVAEAEVVLVHDAARPLVSSALVDAVAAAARDHGAAIPVVPVADSLKRITGGQVTGALSRAGLYAAQTPQGARREILLAALEAMAGGTETFTDEAELLERYGVPVASVPGEPANLKLTIPSDLAVARSLRRATGSTANDVRVGYGEDVHPFGPVMGLRLGGIEIPSAPRLHGHSDGDVVLHAICDGLLGAAGLRDLGRAFPAGDAGTRGISSADLVVAIVAQLGAAGSRPRSVDVTIFGARPRLGGARLDAMADAIASLLGVARSLVAVKASSGNLSGDDGAGRVIRAAASVTVARR